MSHSSGGREFHIQVLLDEFDRRLRKNARYSIRAYAKSLGLHPSAVSRIFAGKQELSLTASLKILKSLHLDANSQRLFLHSVVETRKKREIEQLERLIDAPTLRLDPVEMDLSTFELIADFHNVAVLEACLLDDASDDPSWFAEKLGIGEEQAAAALSRLVEAGLLRKLDGRYEKIHQSMTAKSTSKTHDALRKHHRQAIDKALESLQSDPIEARRMVSMAVALAPEKLSVAKVMIEDFMGQLGTVLEAGPRSLLYHLNIQFFPVSRPTPHTSEDEPPNMKVLAPAKANS